MQSSSIIIEENLDSRHDRGLLYSEEDVCQDFMKLNNISENGDDVRVAEFVLVDDVSDDEDDGDDDDDDEEEEEEEEFSFFCGEENRSPIAAEDAFSGGQIKTSSLPARPPVKKVFVETKEVEAPAATSSSAGDDVISGPYCEWTSNRRRAVEASPPPEVCKKSNSTGFSKIWRIKEFAGRCNSDGRDAFVFLNNGSAPPQPPAAAAAKAEVKAEIKTEQQSTVKIIRKVKKSKTASLSPHEVYLRSKAKGEERRRSYLPYRPELVGFFTNVNGGLTKNVHPF
ncbi:hypothetical protein MIMGU_mgv1a011428mg [Erythranthe guttata]|uniref:Uncharacterized protein n=1 Tax=Erythranthe guttata TaxID=4155 RepID=A0A022Q3H2_ERYGU|nr:hypothetical protein MIMGU_mgv1a011428mg [Erythranthe guttata]